VKTHERIIEVKRRLGTLMNFMEKNTTAARNPVRKAQEESYSKALGRLLEDVDEIEKEIAGEQLAELQAELVEIQRIEGAKRRRTRVQAAQRQSGVKKKAAAAPRAIRQPS